jgi:UDP-N-acetylmuramoyl-tripeptide--D-alanyl-D-alanine ligase
MLELGSSAEQYHRELGVELVERCGADLVIACGQYAATTAASARAAGMPAARTIACRSVEQVKSVLEQHLLPDDVVLVKGSRRMRMERVVAWLREQLDRPEPYTLALPRPLAAAA